MDPPCSQLDHRDTIEASVSRCYRFQITLLVRTGRHGRTFLHCAWIHNLQHFEAGMAPWWGSGCQSSLVNYTTASVTHFKYPFNSQSVTIFTETLVRCHLSHCTVKGRIIRWENIVHDGQLAEIASCKLILKKEGQWPRSENRIGALGSRCDKENFKLKRNKAIKASIAWFPSGLIERNKLYIHCSVCTGIWLDICSRHPIRLPIHRVLLSLSKSSTK